MKNGGLCFGAAVAMVLAWHCCLVASDSGGGDAAAMEAVKKGLTELGNLNWSDPNPCKWDHVQCDSLNRVTRIQIGDQNLRGSLAPDLKNLKSLQRLEVMRNRLSGPVPTLSGSTSLQILLLHSNTFSSLPSDLFSGLSSLRTVDLGDNPFSPPWTVPASLLDAVSLQRFSANNANVVGPVPGFLGESFPGLEAVHLAFNALEGTLPASLAGSPIQSLWLSNNKADSRLGGEVRVLQDMRMLREVWLNGNHFTGPLPDLSQVTSLRSLNLRDNDFTGIVPATLVKIRSLRVVNLTNNHFQGSPPKFDTGLVQVDMMENRNSFCVNDPGAPCDPRVDVLLSIAESMFYPQKFAETWRGNDPCRGWPGITCSGGNITVIVFRGMGLVGTISPRFSELVSLQILILSDNLLNGSIPSELAMLPDLRKIDVSNNNLYGDVPHFGRDVDVIVKGNELIGKKLVVGAPPVSSSSSPDNSLKSQSVNGDGNVKVKKTYSVVVVVGGSVGGVLLLGLVGIAGLSLYNRRRRSCVFHSSDDIVMQKITISASRANLLGSKTYSYASHGHSDLHVVESGNNMVMSIDMLREVTENFSDDHVIGRGGFGTVYRGELHDGTMVAVKRMESGVINNTGLAEFNSEVSVLTQVRHRHLVSFLGYSFDEVEKLLVYEYMPRGTLGMHLFGWKKEGLKPLEWARRVVIALDVARGVEYLHGLAHQSFIHRDLKPTNILLGDDMRAKVADFGLVRLASEGNESFETKLAGTFGYIAPEYAATGRVSMKVDVFSFGVILMELITGRKALEADFQLMPWFQRMYGSKESFTEVIDPTIALSEEVLGSISTVAELASHCCAGDPGQRPAMCQAVNVLSSLVELWKPREANAQRSVKNWVPSEEDLMWDCDNNV